MVNIFHMKSQEAINNIKFKAESAGFLMADVCRVAAIDQAQVSRWLKGTTEPLYNTVIRLEEACDNLISARLQVINKAMDEAIK